jgi:hypothetical protein
MGAAISLAAPACGTVKLNIKTWYLDADQAEAIKPRGVLIRKHENAATEVLDAEEAKAYRCLSAKDFDYVLYLAKQAGVRGIQ